MPIDIPDKVDRTTAFLTILAGSIWGYRRDPVTWLLLTSCIAADSKEGVGHEICASLRHFAGSRRLPKSRPVSLQHWAVTASTEQSYR
jgi:hypothetical protein